LSNGISTMAMLLLLYCRTTLPTSSRRRQRDPTGPVGAVKESAVLQV
jgi:hypothetical protein